MANQFTVFIIIVISSLCLFIVIPQWQAEHQNAILSWAIQAQPLSIKFFLNVSFQKGRFTGGVGR